MTQQQPPRSPFPPPPIQTPHTDANGNVTKPWAEWYQKVTTSYQSNLQQNVIPVSANYTANPGDTAQVNTASGNKTITLPLSAKSTNTQIRVVKISSDGNTVTVAAQGTDKINGASTKVQATQYQIVTYIPDGQNGWYAT